MNFWQNQSPVFKTFILLAFATAIFHARHFWRPVDESPGWRHALFIGIALGLAWALWTKSRFLLPGVLILTIQQFYSHGSRLLRWANEGRVDWISVLVLAVMPWLCWVVWKAQKQAQE